MPVISKGAFKLEIRVTIRDSVDRMWMWCDKPTEAKRSNRYRPLRRSHSPTNLSRDTKMQKGENERKKRPYSKNKREKKRCKRRRRRNAKATRETMYCPDEKPWITMAKAKERRYLSYTGSRTPSVVRCRRERNLCKWNCKKDKKKLPLLKCYKYDNLIKINLLT